MKSLWLALPAALALVACNKAAAPAASPTPSTGTSPSTVVATYQGGQITLGELDSKMARELHEMRSETLERMLLERIVEAEAKKAGKTPDQLLEEVASKAAGPKPSEEELKKVYEENKDRFGGRSFEEIRPMLERSAGGEASQQAVGAYLDELKKKASVKVLLSQPRVTVAGDGPSKGPKDAPVTIIEFSDFECPYCSRARKTADQLVAAYAGKVRLVFRDFPLPFHAHAAKASEAGLCAEEQGKFWEMHDQMFDNQNKLAVEDLKAAARKIGLNGEAFDKCLDSGKSAARIETSIRHGKEAGVEGTPAFFVNGRLLSGAQPYEKFREIVEEELARAN